MPARWQPRRLTGINDDDVKVAKFEGESIRHSHPDADELFVALGGTIMIDLRDRSVTR